VVTAAGGEVVSPLTNSPSFDRWAKCRDDQGVRFGFRQPSGRLRPRPRSAGM
jgi:predicted enzyme related to lactoylglutathione lyase